MPVGVAPRHGPPRGSVGTDPAASWLRRALPLALTHKWLLGTSLALSFASLIIQVAVPDLLRRAIDGALVGGATGLDRYVLWITALGVAFGALTWAARTLLLRAAYAIEYDLRNLLYEHLTRLSAAFYDGVQSGELISRANSDVRAVQMYLAFAPSILVQCGVALLAFAVMLTIDVPLALLTMATTPLVALAVRQMLRFSAPTSWLIQARLAEVATLVDENVNGVRVVKSFAAEGRQLRALAAVAERVRWALIKDSEVRGRWAPVIENLPRIGLVLLLAVGGWMAIHGHTTVGTIVAFNSYVLMLQVPFRSLGMLIMMGQRASASARRIFEILDREPAVADAPGARDLRGPVAEVRFDDVGFSYPDGTRALDRFDARLRGGEAVAIVGRTGSGKSTVVRLLGRAYDAGAGAVRIDGADVREVTVASLRAAVGSVFDEPFLFSASIRDNIAYGRPDARQEEVVAAARAAEADGFIRALADGYDTVVGERGYTLSGGQRQRIAIARALLVNPPILVLDDATSAIDVQVEARIHTALREHLRGRTTVILAHRRSTVGLADRVLLVDGGRVVDGGTHAELLERAPGYAELFGGEDRLAGRAD